MPLRFLKRRTFRKGGIHPAENKLTSDKEIIEVSAEGEVAVLLQQCLGAPPKCVVSAGQKVAEGEVIAQAEAFVCAPVHSPVFGTVKRIDRVRDAQGMWRDAVIIACAEDGERVLAGELSEQRGHREVSELSRQEIIDIVAKAGIVGLGGATFPTRVKLTIPEGKKVDAVILNGAECEPYLTCDDRLMRSHAAGIVKGCRLIMRAVDAPKAIIGIEENKPEAIEAIRKEVGNSRDMKVIVLKKKYPQGGEKQLIAACMNRHVGVGWLPVDVGAVVDNVATAYAIYDAVYNGRPLTRRVVTVTGPSLKSPGNFLVPLGTPVSRLLELAGGIPEDTGKVIAGGPMMGRAVSCLDAPSTKGLSGILVLPQSMARRREEEACIRCGKCVEACPMGLEPYLIMDHALIEDWESAAATHSRACIECGSCSYTCPSARPILDHIRHAKAQYRKMGK